MTESKEKWNVTFKREGGKWSVPKVFSTLALALKTMRYDNRGYKMSGEYDVEIRRGRTRKGMIIRQYKR